MILRIYRRALSYVFVLFLNKKKVKLAKNVFFLGLPIFQIKRGGLLTIGENVTINSSNLSYHLNMFKKSRIIIKEDARLTIGSNTRIHGTCIHCYQSIQIGKNVLIAANTQIIESNGHDLSFENVSKRIETSGKIKSIIIGDNVWIGTGVVILPGVNIGEGSIISANSVVNEDIPPMSIAVGNPAKVIKTF